MTEGKALKAEIEQLVNAQIHNDENFANGVQYLQSLIPPSLDEDENDDDRPRRLIRPVAENRKVREALEQREMELFENFSQQFAQMNDQVQGFVSKIKSMNDVCNDLSNRIQSNKEKTRDLLRKTSILQTEKKNLQAKEAYLNEFFDKYSLAADDEKALNASNDGTINESFFRAFKKLIDVIERVDEAARTFSSNMSSPGIKYFAIMRLFDNLLLTSECLNSANQTNYRNEFKTLMRKLEDVDLQPEERQKIRSQNGAWYITCDKKRIYYAVLVDSAYPERHAYALINDVIEQLQGLRDYHMESDITVSAHTKRYVPKLMEKYCDLKSVDKLYAANQQVSEITTIMGENLRKASVNAENLNRIQKNSEKFKDLASDFYQSSDELAKHAAGNKRKMLIIAGAAVTVFSGAVFFVFF